MWGPSRCCSTPSSWRSCSSASSPLPPGARTHSLRPHARPLARRQAVAFSYLGDICVVETIGGIARPVTLHPAHDINPVFSPDGQHIAFSSNRHGSYNVFVVPSSGGKPHAPDLRLRRRPGHRLVARRQERPLRLDAGTVVPARRAVHRPGRGRPGPRSPSPRARRGRARPRRQARLRPRPGRLVSQGLSRLVERRPLAREPDGPTTAA